MLQWLTTSVVCQQVSDLQHMNLYQPSEGVGGLGGGGFNNLKKKILDIKDHSGKVLTSE